MTDQRTSDNSAQNIAEAIQEVSERAQLLVREEVELAKAEVTEKITKLAKGAAIAAAAGIFVIFAVFLFLEGLAWLAWYEIPFPDFAYFWGFFVVAAILLLLGALAGFIASRAFKAGSPPKPEMAIDEAKLIRETVQSSHPEQTV
ncbi:MAG TPA: phage holin family protein [Solirubrobacteraceae bacterium]|jgi:hypothetical protein